MSPSASVYLPIILLTQTKDVGSHQTNKIEHNMLSLLFIIQICSFST